MIMTLADFVNVKRVEVNLTHEAFAERAGYTEEKRQDTSIYF